MYIASFLVSLIELRPKLSKTENHDDYVSILYLQFYLANLGTLGKT
jgi:hypothetical protein